MSKDLKKYSAARVAMLLALTMILASCSKQPIVKPSPEIVEIATSISCFKEEYGPYLEPIYPPFSADHGKLPYGELKYRYSQLMLLLGESNKDKDSISYILTQPVED